MNLAEEYNVITERKFVLGDTVTGIIESSLQSDIIGMHLKQCEIADSGKSVMIIKDSCFSNLLSARLERYGHFKEYCYAFLRNFSNQLIIVSDTIKVNLTQI